ncbi:MAG: V-type ATPase subunit [Patescibacteria group bacterium]|nr:V-type ATPase subunit [Patescibacteria group bacterium]
MSRSKYLYATGLIRSKENKLLNQAELERMLDAPDAEQAFRVFNDTDYADNLLDVPVKNFNQALQDDLRQVRELFFQIVPDENLLKILFIRYDFQNIKLLFKEKYSHKNTEDYASDLGVVNFAKLKQVILEDAKNELPSEIKFAIDYIKNKIETEGVQPNWLDRWSDWQYFETLYALGQKTKNKFIQELIKLQIDIANLKIFIRGKRMQRSSEYIVSEILEKGSLDLDDFARLVEKPLEEGLIEIKNNFSKDASIFIDHYLEHQNLSELEKDLENMELDFVRQTKWIGYGPEILVGYYLAKKNAIRNVRLVMTGKLNNIPAEELKQRQRNLF